MGLTASKDLPLHIAVLQNDSKRVTELIESRSPLNRVDADGRSPARIAFDLGYVDVLKTLWQHGGRILPEFQSGRSLLHEAVAREDSHLVLAILKASGVLQRGASPQDKGGRTPLHIAAEIGNPDLVALLLKYNSRPDVADNEGRTPLDLANGLTSPAAKEVVALLSMQDLMVKRAQARRTKSLSPDDRLRIAKGPCIDVRASRPDSLPKDLSQPSPKKSAPKLSPKGQAGFSHLEDALKLSRLPVIKSEELQFEDMLSRGSSCVVFKGKWRGCEVAIKQFKTEYRTGKKELMKFVKEMMVLAQVRHPNLLLLMGICIDRPNLCLITEFVPNFSLFYAIHSEFHTENKSRKLSLSEKFEIAVQICKGLAYLHSNNPPILHRDLKPENCLLDNALNVKIADFGLARPLTQFRTEETQDQTTTCIGTTRFMAPELFYKDQVASIGVEVDIWALGCVLIELFSGRRPWDYISSSNSSSIYYEVSDSQIFKQKPVPIPENIPTDVATVIAQCCNYTTRRRPSASFVLEQLLSARSKQLE